MKTKPCFIIAHRYVRGYTSYIEHYIDNINLFYENALIIIVDNNSPYRNDVLDKFKSNDNIILLDNNTEHKFEQGAYLVGVTYLIENNLVDNYDYYVFTQDTYILKNKYNFDELIENNVYACPISWGRGDQDFDRTLVKNCVKALDMWDNNYDFNYDLWFQENNCYKDIFDCCCISCKKEISLKEILQKKVLQCFCTVYIIHKIKINDLYNILKKIKITTRRESEVGERYFGYVLFKLNNNKNYQIDHNPWDLYNMWEINLHEDFKHGFFAKQQQRKRENIID